jgi:hypothetical protein
MIADVTQNVVVMATNSKLNILESIGHVRFASPEPPTWLPFHCKPRPGQEHRVDTDYHKHDIGIDTISRRHYSVAAIFFMSVLLPSIGAGEMMDAVGDADVSKQLRGWKWNSAYAIATASM